jgi:tRNA pseudouridine55 synthase
MSRRKTGRDIDGMLLLDKPPGMTSNGAVQRVKRLFQANKAGHTGSLDPIATGLLPICLGEATKLSGFLLNDDKRYETRLRLGQTTDTADSEGAVLEEKPVPALSEPLIEAALAPLRGEIEQVPPMYSALKHQGRKLYELARLGVEIERAPRRVMIYELRLLGFGPDYLDLEAHCSKGTYIRSLAVDIGAALGCGAHVSSLRRTAVGAHALGQAITLEQLEALDDAARLARLTPLVDMIERLPVLEISADLAFFIRRGQAVFVPNAPTAGLLGLVARGGAFLGIGEVSEDGKIAPRRLTQDPASRKA